jgi:hypothetical protein
MDAFLDQSEIEIDSSGTRILTPPQHESLAKKIAVTFDVNPKRCRAWNTYGCWLGESRQRILFCGTSGR